MKNILCLLFITLFHSGHAFSQFETFAAKYDTLSTIAGVGQFDNKGVNGWLEKHEGSAAIDAELSRPHFAMADSMGNIYIADKDAHAIRMVSTEGIISTVAGTSIAGDNGDGLAIEQQLSSPNGVWVNPDGSFFILDLGNNKIRKVDREGNMLTFVHDPMGISLGRGLWVSKDEQLMYYVNGSRIRKWSKLGGISDYANNFSSPGHIIVDPSGNLVVTDRGANRVYRILEDGSKIIIAGNGSHTGGGNGSKAIETGLYGVRGIWFLEDGSYLLATHEGSQIWYVDTDGIINLFLDGRDGDAYHAGDGEHFQTPGFKISEARGISVDYDGNIIITENDRGFIRKIARKRTNTRMDRSDYKSHIDFSVYPNPFTSELGISYTLYQASFVEIHIYNATGQKIKTLLNAEKPIGNHRLRWDGTNGFGSLLRSGIFFCRFKAGDQMNTKVLFLN